jgi:hypothetical protein
MKTQKKKKRQTKIQNFFGGHPHKPFVLLLVSGHISTNKREMLQKNLKEKKKKKSEDGRWPCAALAG